MPTWKTVDWKQTAESWDLSEPDDKDRVLDICHEHAVIVCGDVWGSTIDLDALEFRWNTRLRRAALRYIPVTHSKKPYGIEIAPGYYEHYGLEDLLEGVRHELIHAWQDQHPDGGKLGHGPKFHQWIAPLRTHRHCRPW